MNLQKIICHSTVQNATKYRIDTIHLCDIFFLHFLLSQYFLSNLFLVAFVNLKTCFILFFISIYHPSPFFYSFRQVFLPFFLHLLIFKSIFQLQSSRSSPLFYYSALHLSRHILSRFFFRLTSLISPIFYHMSRLFTPIALSYMYPSGFLLALSGVGPVFTQILQVTSISAISSCPCVRVRLLLCVC